MPLEAILPHFNFTGKFVQAVPTGNGHIHDTFAVTYELADGLSHRYILQKINRSIFKDPPTLMQNIERVTRHLRYKIEEAGRDPAREALSLVKNTDRQTFFQDPSGEYWRAYLLIEGARTYEIPQNLHQIYQAALAFGQFQLQLADFPVEQLVEILPGFHDTPKRFDAFTGAVQRDPCNRAHSVRQEIHFLEQHEQHTRILVDLSRKGQLPLRVAHNDTKLNNVLIDDLTGKGICVLDLDTVMPGTALSDFGDMVRTSATLIAEDDPDLTKGGISLEAFDCLAHGYLNATRSLLTPTEMDHLAVSACLITLEQAIRFLTDYLNGDIYYKIQRPVHNLDRARTQIVMLADMEKKFDQMDSIVSRYR